MFQVNLDRKTTLRLEVANQRLAMMQTIMIACQTPSPALIVAGSLRQLNWAKQVWTSKRSTLTSLSSWTQSRLLIVEWQEWQIVMIVTLSAFLIKTQSAEEAFTTTRFRQRATAVTIIQATKCIRMSLVLAFRRMPRSLKCHHSTWCMDPVPSCLTTITLGDLTTKKISSVDTLIKNRRMLLIKLQIWCLTSSQSLANLAKSTFLTSMEGQLCKTKIWTWEKANTQPVTWLSMEHRQPEETVQTSTNCQANTTSIKVTPFKQTQWIQETTPRWCTFHLAPLTTSSLSSQTLTWCSTS